MVTDVIVASQILVLCVGVQIPGHQPHARMAQLASAPDSQSGGCGFESHCEYYMLPWRNWLAHQIFILEVAGSSPAGSTNAS